MQQLDILILLVCRNSNNNYNIIRTFSPTKLNP